MVQFIYITSKDRQKNGGIMFAMSGNLELCTYRSIIAKIIHVAKVYIDFVYDNKNIIKEFSEKYLPKCAYFVWHLEFC